MDAASPPRQSKSSHIRLQWLLGVDPKNRTFGTSRLELIDGLSEFARSVLHKFDIVNDRTEDVRQYRALKPADQRWVDINHVSIFLDDLRSAATVRKRLSEGHNFVLAVNRDPITHKDVVVGVSDFVRKKNQMIGQFTCVHPEYQRWGIGTKLTRGAHGFARLNNCTYYGGNLSTSSQMMYGRYIAGMPTYIKQIKFKRPKNKRQLPNVTIKFKPMKRLRRKGGK